MKKKLSIENFTSMQLRFGGLYLLLVHDVHRYGEKLIEIIGETDMDFVVLNSHDSLPNFVPNLFLGTKYTNFQKEQLGALGWQIPIEWVEIAFLESIMISIIRAIEVNRIVFVGMMGLDHCSVDKLFHSTLALHARFPDKSIVFVQHSIAGRMYPDTLILRLSQDHDGILSSWIMDLGINTMEKWSGVW